MAITKVSNSGFKSGMTKYDSFLAGNEAYDPAATFLISRTTLSSDTATVTFSSIPSTYKHLQLRILARGARADTDDYLKIIINSDTGSNYSRHQLLGTGSAVSAFGAASQSLGRLVRMPANNVTASVFGNCVTDLHDYTSTSINKTFRSAGGWDENGAGQILLTSGAWLSTSAITNIQVGFEFGNIKSGSTFALYGFTG